MRQIHSTVRLAVALLVAAIFVSVAHAQEASCGRFQVSDTIFPIYPPIARIAHMTATIRFRVVLPAQGLANACNERP
jgi:hypothetical protein